MVTPHADGSRTGWGAGGSGSGRVGLRGSRRATTSVLGMTEYRIEHDSMGEVRVPATAKYAAQTQRAVENFPISGQPIEGRLIRALALIKGEAAVVNGRLKDVPKVSKAIG